MNLRLMFLLLTAAALVGCEHPTAQLATLQDAKYPVSRDSKIAMSENFNPNTSDLATRLAGETIAEQMQAMGFHVTTPAEADFLLFFSVADKDVSQTYTVSVPTISNMVGTAGDHPVSGTVFGSDTVPQTRLVSKTYLKLWLQRTHEPKVDVWNGSINTEAAELQKYRTPFFQALLQQIGATSNGYVQLDAAEKTK